MTVEKRAFRAVNCPEPVEGIWFVYILSCRDGSFYCGSANDLDNRLKEHNGGEGASWTEKRRPVELIYFETYDSLPLARRREKQIKGWTRAKKINLITGFWGKVN